MTVRFEEAWCSCIEVLRKHSDGVLSTAEKIVLVRDLFGRMHLALQRSPGHDRLGPLLDELAAAAGPFWSSNVLDGAAMFAPEAVFASSDTLDQGSGIWTLERSVIGAEWNRGPIENRQPQPPRAALYGIKGGVGRSTALAVWARHLATLDKRVLVIDLDLESPGVSSLLLPPDGSADFGVVDWFVEEAVGNVDPELIQLMVARSPIARGTTGEVIVAPCHGTVGKDYLAKLSRVYVDLPGTAPSTFAQRLAELVDQLEEQHRPDVVLLDSRAGLHDIAAVVTTRLNAMTFLFAAGTRQTWDGYRILLRSWAKCGDIASDVRSRLRVVASQIPETERPGYLERLRQSSYDVFSETLYEEAGPDDIEAFNFDIDATDAPHDPLKIYWSRALQDWDPVSGEVTPAQLDAAFGDFLERATELLLPRPNPDTEVDLG